MEEKKISVKYSIIRYEDGSIDVEDAGVEGTTPLASEQIYKDIEDVAKIIELKRVENAASAGAFNGIARFYAQVQAQQEEAKAAEATAEPTAE